MALESLSAVCGISSAVAWGTGDFSGGLASRKSNEFTVVLFSQLIGAFFLVGLVLFSAENSPSMKPLVFGAILKERLVAQQWCGVVVAMAALICIA